MTTPHPYVIASDNDGHKYVIPRNKRDEWCDWLDTPAPALDLPEDQIDFTAWNVPEWAEPVGSSADLVTFNLDGTYTIR